MLEFYASVYCTLEYSSVLISSDVIGVCSYNDPVLISMHFWCMSLSHVHTFRLSNSAVNSKCAWTHQCLWLFYKNINIIMTTCCFCQIIAYKKPYMMTCCYCQFTANMSSYMTTCCCCQFTAYIFTTYTLTTSSSCQFTAYISPHIWQHMVAVSL